MKILRFDSVGGASGDMILNALLELCEMQGIPQKDVEDPLRLLIPNDPFHLHRSAKASHGMSGKMLDVEIHDSCGHEHHAHEHHHEHAHVHRSYADIRSMIQESALPDAAKELSLAVFGTLAEAEGKVHGKPAEEVHFHEVGAVDSIIDIVGSCIAFTRLEADGISLSPLPVGSGTVRCAHGVYPLPAPATQELLQKFHLPVSGDNEPCEMLTPTAAALFSVWKKAEIPSNAQISASFNSFGHREMESRPNVLRVTRYESCENSKSGTEFETESLIQLECNLDDATGEQLSSTMRALFASGALDVWFTPITMKKQRPAVLLGLLVLPAQRNECIRTLFLHSGTFGIREFPLRRHFLARRWENVETPFGTVRMKIGTLGGSDVQFSPEFDDCQAAADAQNVPVSRVIQSAVSKYLAAK